MLKADKLLYVFVLSLFFAAASSAWAQAPVVTIDAQQHGDLAAAQEQIVQAYAQIVQAQRTNAAHLGGHAQRAKEFLSQANEELQFAADQADKNGNASEFAPPTAAAAPAPVAAPLDLSGTWTIFAYNTREPGSSLKTIEISQIGNIISGKFHGPHQHGKLQGWVNGNHIEFSTDTREVLTFRGEITAEGMSGMYGVNGQHAPWKAERTK
ncbi:hypothetical protein HNQ77_001603 [Silvibacterium bohemicum]|uniref:Uncharacterized protein n=1 Tax=Silvibacterium bohemicum TaxID=1577686 RepID=A0A841K089_9BACT|nr:hypothetical protein [Silvibacterium bohemicum]MBB6143654.1 hypothetical protein [Silvibacterium bohemicum]